MQKLLPQGHRTYFELDSNHDHFGQMVTVPLQNVRSRVTRKSKKKEDKAIDAIVLASGNVGLIYFTQWADRISLEDINKTYPEMVKGLSQHEGVSFAMIRSKEQGPVVIGASGKYYLADDNVEGDNPLAKFGKRAAAHLRRLDSFNCVPDILLISMYDTEKDEWRHLRSSLAATAAWVAPSRNPLYCILLNGTLGRRRSWVPRTFAGYLRGRWRMFLRSRTEPNGITTMEQCT